MIWLLSLLCHVSFAEILVVSKNITQEESQQLSNDVASILQGQEEIEIRTSRFFVKGEGYKYRVVIAGFKTQDAAAECQKDLDGKGKEFSVQRNGQTYQIPEKEEKKEQNSEVSHINEEPKEEEINRTATKEKKKFRDRLIPEVSDVFIHARNAHQITASGGEETFFFTRILPQDGTTVYHEFYQKGDAMRLDITVEKGDGVNSTTVLPDEGEAWVRTDEKMVSRNAIRTKELLERFSAQNILSVPFHFSADVNSDSEWQDLVRVKDGDDVWILEADKSEGLISASFHKTSWLLNHVEVSDGTHVLEYEFQDYRKIAQVGMMPFVIQIYDEELLSEEIRVKKYEISKGLKDELFLKKEE